MNRINTVSDLKIAIEQLNEKRADDFVLLKGQLQTTYEGFKPISIIKDVFNQAIASPDIKTDMVNAAIGLTTGIVTKKLLIGKTINPIKKLLGNIVEMVVANKVVNNSQQIKAIGNIILKKLLSKNNKLKKEIQISLNDEKIF